MANELPGASPLQSALSKLGTLPAQDRANLTKTAFEGIARETNIPANLLIALDEEAGGTGDAKRARENAMRLAETLRSGGTIEDAVGSFAGEEGRARSIINRSYDIADAMYPAQKAPAPPPETGGGVISGAADIAKAAAGSGVSALGSGIRAAGVAGDELLKGAIERFGSRPAGAERADPVEGETFVRGAGRALGDLTQSGGAAITETMSEEGKRAREGFQPKGELFSPSTWSMGEDPSLFGAVLASAEGLGSMAPMLATSNPLSAAVMGGLMAGGEGAQNGRQFVIDAATVTDENGEPEIAKLPEYQKLRSNGRSHEQATMELARSAESNAGFRQAMFGALGGAATNRIFRGAEGWLGSGGRLASASKKAAAGFVEEGSQEALEGAASQSGIAAATGADMNLGEDSFGNFILGGMAGGAAGAAGGALFGGQARGTPSDDASAEGSDDPLMLPPPDNGQSGPAGGSMGALPAPDGQTPRLPSPTNGGAIIGEGRSGYSPDEFEQDPNRPRRTDDLAAQPAEFRASPGKPSPLVEAMGAMPEARETAPLTGTEQFRPSQQNSIPDGSGNGAVAAPDGGTFLSDSSGAAANIGMSASVPRGPIEAIAQTIQVPDAPRQEAIRFPEYKAGSSVRLGDPETGEIFDGVFIGESADGAHVRIAGRETVLPPEVFDMGRDAVGKIEADRRATEQAQNAIQPESAVNPATPISDVQRGAETAKADALSPQVQQAPYPVGDSMGAPARAERIDDVATAPEDALRARLDFLNAQGQRNGWNRATTGERDVLHEELQRRAPPQEKIERAAAQADPEPTEAQKEAGNYRKGHTRWNGMDLSIENARGSERKGTDRDGKEWSVTMPAHYGYFKGTVGADGDHVDFYMGENGGSNDVFVVDQYDADTGKFDEHKVMLGYGSRDDAITAYDAGFSDGRGADRRGEITELDADGLKEWLAAGAAKGPLGRTKNAAQTQAGEIRRSIVKEAKASTPRGRKVKVEYAIVDLNDVIPSQQDDGRKNPAYPQELQPRDRTRDTSQEQIRRIAQKLDPELLGENPQAGNGAPIILKSGEVVSGNGRTLALRRAAQEFPQSMEAYRGSLAEKGYPVDGIANPVLVRVVRDDMDMKAAARLAREANESEQQAMSASEQAMSDAQMLMPAILDLYRGGDIDMAQNRDFVRAFIRDVASETDAGRMHDSGNRLTQDAIRRINGALLARAYGDAGIVGAVLETADTNIRAIGGALTDVAAKWSQMRVDVERGDIAADADRTPALVEAVKLVDRARKQERPITDFVDQTDIFDGESVSPAALQFLEIFYRDTNYRRARGRAGVAQALDFYVTEALKTTPSVDMFGDSADTDAILNTARARANGNEETGQSTEPERAEPSSGASAAGSGEGRTELETETPANGVGDRLGEPGRGADLSPAPADPEGSQPDEPSITEVGADGLPQTVMPGLEASAEQAKVAASARAKSEMQARQQQSKIRKVGGNSGDAGPMFDQNQDLFAEDRPSTPVDKNPVNQADSDSSTPREKIEDFGEKLGGARKDVWGGYSDKMRDAADIDVRAEPLSKSWPAPDYEKLIGAGIDPWTVSFLRVARDSIPTKPKQAWKLDGWVKNVSELRAFANMVMDGTYPRESVEKRIRETRGLSQFAGTLDLYAEVGHSKSLKGIKFGQTNYSVLNGIAYNPAKTFWEVSTAAKATAFSNMPRTIARAETKEAALAAFKKAHGSLDATQEKAKQAPKFIIYNMHKGQYYSVGTKLGSTYLELRKVDTVAEARRLVKEDADALEADLIKRRTLPADRRDENAPRVGIDHRSGADVTPQQFGEAFGFRGVEFGNWVEGKRRQQDLNNAYDALMDLAGVIGVPAPALSLNGTLGLAFGARGTGGVSPAAAHYEPGKVVINLTKMNGAGSLAHEWFHAIDNYFAKARTDRRGSGYISDNAAPGRMVEGVRDEVVDAFVAVRHAIGKTDLKKRSGNIDKTRSKPYWATGIEMHARAFESYVIAKLQDQSLANDYLANVVDGVIWQMQAELSGLGDSYPYLKADELAVVRPAFDSLFDALETRETEQGVELYQKVMGEVKATEKMRPADIKAVSELASKILAAHGLTKAVSTKLMRGLLSASGVPVLGAYRAGKISVDADATNAGSVMRHEIIHALRDSALWGRPYGLFTQAEWQALAKAARADQGIREAVEAAYPELTTAQKTEEMIAELYAEWATDRDLTRPAPLVRAFERAKSFLRAVVSALRGEGFIDAASIMQGIADGTVASRGPDGDPNGDQGGVEKQKRDTATLKGQLSRSKGAALGMMGRDGWKKGPAFLSNLLTDSMGANARFNLLSLVPGHPLFTELGKNLSAAQEYLGLKQSMDADRNEWQSRSAKMVDRWTAAARRNPDANGDLMALMHDATLAGIDPSIQDGWKRLVDGEADRVTGKDTKDRQQWAEGIKKERAERQKTYETLQARMEKLPKEFRQLFEEVRNEYAAMADAVDAALMENIRAQSRITIKKADREHRKEMRRINDEGMTGTARREAVDKANEKKTKAHARAARGQGSRLKQLRQMFEQNRVQGPYFPLARFGNYFVTIRDGDGKVVSFSRFETEREQKSWAESEDAKKLGKVQTGVLGMTESASSEVDPRFIADIEGILDEAGAGRDMMDAVYQRWLETLPDQSIRTSQIHRKGRAGYHKDAVRAFASSMFHGAHQSARLRYGAEMEEALEVAEEQATNAPDANRAGFVVREMKQRHAFTMNPTNNPWVSKVTGLAFVWYLGMSPAAALVNVSQTTVVGVPILAARFKQAGVTGAISELTRASKDFMQGKAPVTKRVNGIPVLTDTWGIEHAPSLSADERRAMAAGYDRGVIDKTQAHDLASVADSGVEYNSTREKVMRVIGFMFHHTERFNREVTYLAAYRMARAEGLGHELAITSASSMVWKTHFDYSNTSKPRAMQGDAAKVLLIFRNFQVNMLYRLFRDTHQAMKGANKEDRREARAQLIGITLSMMGHAGIRGVWGYGLLMGLLSLFFPGDADDMDEWLQDALLMEGDDMLTAGWNWGMGMALNGVPGHALGVSLTNRIGMPELWFRSPDKDMEGKDLWAFYIEQAAGPAVGIGGSVLSGLAMMGDGQFLRGAEKMTPTFARNVIKTTRYAKDGVTTYYGDQLTDDLNPWQMLMQLQGFSPAEVSERYQVNNRLKKHEKRITEERKGIVKEIGDFARSGEPIPEQAIDKLRDFNRRFPEYPISSDTIRQSIRSRDRASQRNEFGVALNPKLNDRLRSERAPSVYN